MAVPSNTHQTYQAVGIREDLADVIYRVAPEETPFINAAGRGKATNTYHEWQIEDLAAASASNAVIEGDDATTDAANLTSRVGNYTQISDKVARTTGTVDAVNKAGRGKELTRQKVLKGLELKRDMEKQLLSNQASNAGAAGTARVSGGLQSWIETNIDLGATGAAGGFASGTTSARTAGTDRPFAETQVQAVMLSCFNNGSRPSLAFMGGARKQDFSAFTGIADIRKDVKGKNQAIIVGAADVYVSDFGEISTVPHPYMDDDVCLLINPDYVSVDYLRPMSSVDLAKTGDSERAQMIVEYTLKVNNEKAHGMIADIAP